MTRACALPIVPAIHMPFIRARPFRQWHSPPFRRSSSSPPSRTGSHPVSSVAVQDALDVTMNLCYLIFIAPTVLIRLGFLPLNALVP